MPDDPRKQSRRSGEHPPRVTRSSGEHRPRVTRSSGEHRPRVTRSSGEHRPRAPRSGEHRPRRPPPRTGPRKRPPPRRPGPPGTAPQRRPPPPSDRRPRPSPPPRKGPPPGVDDAVTPGAGFDGDAESMIFMTHMPGVSVPPRPQDFQNDDELQKLAQDLAGKDREPTEEELAEKRRQEREARKQRAAANLTQKFIDAAGVLSAGAGRGALARTREAAQSDTGPVTGVVRPQTPSFGSLIGGALVQPLRRRSLPAVLGGALMLAVAAILLEASPWLGGSALVVAAVELLGLRLKFVRDAAHGKDEVVWPEWREVAAAIPTYVAALLPFLVAFVLSVAAYGPKAVDTGAPDSVWVRAERIATAGGAAGADGGKSPPRDFGGNAVAMLEAVFAGPSTWGQADRTTAEAARDLRDATAGRLRQLVAPGGASGVGIAARVVLAVALVLFPMALLAGAKLKSLYASLHLPMVVRSVFRAPLAYLFVAVAFVAQDAVLLGAFLNLQVVLRESLPPFPAHAAAVGASALVAVALPVVTGALLGRFYRSHANELAWE